MRPPKTYPLTLAQIKDLSDAITMLDAHITYRKDADIVSTCHQHLERALGTDAGLIYLQEQEAA